MKLTISKSKNAEQLYICKSKRIDKNKTTSTIIKKLGSMASLLPEHDNDREEVIAWAKEQARIMTEEEKKGTLDISVSFSESKRMDMNEKVLYNAGYLFLQKIFHELKLDKICEQIASNRNFEFNLSDILAKMIYSRIIHPSSKRSSFYHSQNDLETPVHDLHQVYRALDVLAENSDFIQAQVYENSKSIIKRNTSVLYYDCTNYFFEIEDAEGLKQYGKSKEHRPNPIVHMGLFLDGNGIPLAFNIFSGNENEQPTLVPLEKQIIKDFNLTHFIVCTDAGLASNTNRKFNTLNNRSYVVTQPLKKLKKYLREWALDPKGWKISENSKKIFDISEINEEIYFNNIFYKERWINENGIEQRIIINYSPKYKAYERRVRERQIQRAQKIIDKGTSARTRNMNSPERFLKKQAVTDDGEIAQNLKFSLDEDKIVKEECYDGFSAVCTTLEDPARTIVEINKRRWEIETAFRVMKSEFKARPVFVRNDERIKTHFLTCYLALLVLRILEKKINDNSSEKFTTEEVISTLKAHKLRKIYGIGYIPAFERTKLTDRLHEISGFRTDKEFITEKSVKKILKQIKN